MSKVWFATKEIRFNVEAASAFGELVYITQRPTSPFNINGLTLDMGNAMEKFDPSNDFIALSGPLPHVAILLAVAAAAYERVRVLIFDARSAEYRSRELDIEFVFEDV